MQGCHLRRIAAIGALCLVICSVGCAHSRPRYTYNFREIHNSPESKEVRVKAPFVDVQVPVASKSDKAKSRDRDRDED